MDNVMLNNKIYLEGKVVSDLNLVMKCMGKGFMYLHLRFGD